MRYECTRKQAIGLTGCGADVCTVLTVVIGVLCCGVLRPSGTGGVACGASAQTESPAQWRRQPSVESQLRISGLITVSEPRHILISCPRHAAAPFQRDYSISFGTHPRVLGRLETRVIARQTFLQSLDSRFLLGLHRLDHLGLSLVVDALYNHIPLGAVCNCSPPTFSISRDA